MDNEGHKSQQDVVGEVKVHPWEEKPEVVVPTSESERAEHAKINDLEKKKARRQKRQAQKAKFFGFVKGHKILSALIGIVVIAAIAGTIVGVILLLSQPKGSDTIIESVEIKETEIKTLDDIAFAPTYVYATVNRITGSNTGVTDSGKMDTAKMEDIITKYIETLPNEYEKTFFEMYIGAHIACNGNTERGQELMKQFDQRGLVLDVRQDVVYLYAKRMYYMCAGDNEKAEEYRKKSDKYYPDTEEEDL